MFSFYIFYEAFFCKPKRLKNKEGLKLPKRTMLICLIFSSGPKIDMIKVRIKRFAKLKELRKQENYRLKFGSEDLDFLIMQFDCQT